jgi:hypothetical protein
MAQRAVELKAPYGARFMNMLNGDIWLMYDNAAPGTSDADILEWMRDTAMLHQSRVEMNALAEASKNVPKVIQIEGAGIAAKAIAQTPPRIMHDWSGPYRIGAACTKCGTKANGLEGKDCSGVMNHNDSTDDGEKV